jgi:hypothetical protein
MVDQANDYSLSIIALNSTPVQALPVLTSEMVPAAAAAINAAMMASLYR